MPMTGCPLEAGPLDHSAQKAVGIPPDPSSTVKPSALSRSTYQAAERYSRQAVSPCSKIVAHQSDRSAARAVTWASAVVCAADRGVTLTMDLLVVGHGVGTGRIRKTDTSHPSVHATPVRAKVKPFPGLGKRISPKLALRRIAG